MSNFRFVVFVSVIGALGFAAGYKLSSLPKLYTHDLLNVIGLFYDFLGVVVLSEILASNIKWKTISVNFIAPAILWLQTVFPIGVFLAAILSHGFSSSIVSRFSIGFLSYSLLPLSILDATVTFPKFAALKNLESRWRWFGLYLLLSGVGSQLIAALLALKS